MTRIEYIIQQNKLPLGEIADEVSISVETLRNYRSGATTPPIDTAKTIAAILARRLNTEIDPLTLFDEVEIQPVTI
jgi:transcriptional regulator with XRE-family HTH domain